VLVLVLVLVVVVVLVFSAVAAVGPPPDVGLAVGRHPAATAKIAITHATRIGLHPTTPPARIVQC
jgi:hypothetical protein